MNKGFIRAIVICCFCIPTLSFASPQVDISKDKTLLELSFERGLDPFSVNEVLEELKNSVADNSECTGKKTREICNGCCKSKYWPKDPRGYRSCLEDCRIAFEDQASSSETPADF